MPSATAAWPGKDALWDTIGRALDAFPEAECQNYLTHCGTMQPESKPL